MCLGMCCWAFVSNDVIESEVKGNFNRNFEFCAILQVPDKPANSYRKNKTKSKSINEYKPLNGIRSMEVKMCAYNSFANSYIISIWGRWILILVGVFGHGLNIRGWWRLRVIQSLVIKTETLLFLAIMHFPIWRRGLIQNTRRYQTLKFASY